MSDGRGDAGTVREDTIRVRPARAHDAPALTTFAATSFVDAFGTAIAPESMRAYLGTAFTPERQAAEIADPEGLVLLAVVGEPQGRETLIGYAHVARTPVPPGIMGGTPLQLKRFYVASAWHGHGAASHLMQHVLRDTCARKASTVWLGVWDQNTRAIAFYQKHGFHVVGTRTFQVGAETHANWLMERTLNCPEVESA